MKAYEAGVDLDSSNSSRAFIVPSTRVLAELITIRKVERQWALRTHDRRSRTAPSALQRLSELIDRDAAETL